MAFKPEHHERPEGVWWHDKSETEQKRRGIDEVLNESQSAFESLVERIRGSLKEGRWDSLLGDDTSGRLPVLVLGRLMVRIAEAKGEIGPQRFFIAGPPTEQAVKERHLRDYLSGIRGKLGKRTLVVTEYIQTGKTIRRLGSLLKQEKIPFDVAALSYDSQKYDAEENLKQFKDADIFAGTKESFSGFGYWLAKEATGVEKQAYTEEPVTSRNFWADPELVAYARQKANELADELYEKYFAQQEGRPVKAA